MACTPYTSIGGQTISRVIFNGRKGRKSLPFSYFTGSPVTERFSSKCGTDEPSAGPEAVALSRSPTEASTLPACPLHDLPSSLHRRTFFRGFVRASFRQSAGVSVDHRSSIQIVPLHSSHRAKRTFLYWLVLFFFRISLSTDGHP